MPDDTPKPAPNPWVRGDGPLPRSTADLIAQIKALAAARQRDALTHNRRTCPCDGCKIHNEQQAA